LRAAIRLELSTLADYNAPVGAVEHDEYRELGTADFARR